LTGAVACAAEDNQTAGLVSVELSEWEVQLPDVSIQAGEVRFSVRNRGVIAHEVVVARTNLASGSLPVSGGMVDLDSDLELIGEIEEVAAGATSNGSFELAPGDYVVFCNLVGHYTQGMHALLRVGG
jgi:uncharacterized cupredoxin-like copper-binding protein